MGGGGGWCFTLEAVQTGALCLGIVFAAASSTYIQVRQLNAIDMLDIFVGRAVSLRGLKCTIKVERKTSIIGNLARTDRSTGMVSNQYNSSNKSLRVGEYGSNWNYVHQIKPFYMWYYQVCEVFNKYMSNDHLFVSGIGKVAHAYELIKYTATHRMNAWRVSSTSYSL